MAYASEEDLKKLYPDNVLSMLVFSDGDNTPIEQSLENAKSEIDMYLSSRYILPIFEPYPYILIEWNCAICIYKRSIELDLLTEERRQRYEDIIKQLEKIAKGTIDIPNVKDSAGENNSSSEFKSANPAILTNEREPRLFTRNKMRGL